MKKVLETRGLTKVFPGVTALDNLNFDLEPGEIHALVGENGAGKSTFVKMLAGVYHPTSGEIFIEGEKKHFNNPREAADYIGVVHQENELVPEFTGYQNLFLGMEETEKGLLRKGKMKEKADRVLQQYKFEVDLNLEAREMSSGKQEILNILKVLYRQPGIIIFDEPTAPLSIKECEILFELLRELRDKGLAIIYISHHLTEVINIADRITVLRNGQKVITLKNEDISEKQLINYMISRDIEVQYPKVKTEIGETIFEVENYTNSRTGLYNISFQICSGEIVGFAGLVGSGRTELAKSIFADSQKNENIRIKGSGSKRQKGLAMIPEDRRQEGLLVDMTVKENLILPHLDELSNLGYLQQYKISGYINSVINKFSIKVTSPEQTVRTLSGGNQQKVSIGKWIGENYLVWIFDEPTQGIDVDAKTEIYTIMGNLAREGSAIWFISSDLRELISIADRIYVMYDFKIVGEFKPPFSREDILTKMMGEK